MSSRDAYLDAASKNLIIALEYLDRSRIMIDKAFKGDDPWFAYADNLNAKAWDYLDAIDIAESEIETRLNTWNDGEYNDR